MDDKYTSFGATKTTLATRFKRVEGQLCGIQSMISSEEDGERVAQQLSAARKVLNKVFLETMRFAVGHEIVEVGAGDIGIRLDKMTALIAKHG